MIAWINSIVLLLKECLYTTEEWSTILREVLKESLNKTP